MERLQKLIARSGLCSRRTAEEYIAAGRVSVNGAVARLGDRADQEKDEITIDGKQITFTEERFSWRWKKFFDSPCYMTFMENC